MKKIFFLLSILFFFSYSHATIYRVGFSGFVNAGTDFAYTDLQGAVNTASAGDTIQIYQQTATSSNGANIYTPLVFIGFGHSLNINAGLQVLNKVDSSLNATWLNFHAGSEGSKVLGLNLYSVNLYTGNITISRCRFRHGSSDAGFVPCFGGGNLIQPNGGGVALAIGYNGIDLNDIRITGCFFETSGEALSLTNYNNSYKVNNLIITNSFFNGVVNLSTSINGQINGLFANNIVNRKFHKLWLHYMAGETACTQGVFTNSPSTTSYLMQSNFDQFLIKNNIFNTADTVSWPLNAPNCIVNNNVFSCASQYAGATLSASNNVYKANMSTVFTAAWNDGLVYNDNQLALSATSLALNAGVKANGSSTACGVFGGEADQEYRLSGIPPVPAVYQLSTPGVNAISNPYNITISVRSNK